MIGIINYCFDVDYLLKKNYIPSLVQNLQAGKKVAGPFNIHSREFKVAWIDSLDSVPEIVVLGSSRTLNLRENSFSGKTFFNASVTNCTFNDMMSFLWLFEEKGKLPNEIIICIDQWLLGNVFHENKWKVLSSEYLKMAEKIGYSDKTKENYYWNLKKEYLTNLFSTRYLFRTLQYWNKKEHFISSDTIMPDKMMFFSDGSRKIPDYVEYKSESDISESAEKYFYEDGSEYFKVLDEQRKIQLEKILTYLDYQNCKVMLFIPPYHHETYKLIAQSEKTAGVIAVDNYIRNLADKYNNVTVIGATNPFEIGLNENDFYDGVHLKTETVNILFK